MHPFRSRLFGSFIPPVRRSRGREIPIILEHLPCSFEPDPLSGKPDPENLRYQAVSKRNNDRFHVEFPEFLDVLVSNSLKAFTKPEIRMLGRTFIGGNEDS
jgi:hypothetical protein